MNIVEGTAVLLVVVTAVALDEYSRRDRCLLVMLPAVVLHEYCSRDSSAVCSSNSCGA
jgi:hypothetical protein